MSNFTAGVRAAGNIIGQPWFKEVIHIPCRERAREVNEMKAKRVKHHDNIPQFVKYSPVPDFITCPACGYEIELWSGGDETRCLFCGHKVFSRELTVH